MSHAVCAAMKSEWNKWNENCMKVKNQTENWLKTLVRGKQDI